MKRPPSALGLQIRRALETEGLAKPLQLPPIKNQARRNQLRPFIGIDGEGCGKDRYGRQHYRLLRAGERELFKAGKPLSTYECLDFICSLPKNAYLVGFGTGYDVTQILRDLNAERRNRLLAGHGYGNGQSPYTWWEDFGLEYIPRKFFAVCRLERPGNGKTQTIEGSRREISETFGFFQCSFVKALEQYGRGKEHWQMIRRNKRLRGKTEVKSITREIRRYNALECQLLAEMMEDFRGMCHDNGLKLRRWSGAGDIAAILHKQHGTPTREHIEETIHPAIRHKAADAYYGGRFEMPIIGEYPKPPLYYDDINSAYPAAMRKLPCLEHGKWQWLQPDQLDALDRRELFVAEVHFSHPDNNILCGLPVRLTTGNIVYPLEGIGTYWSPELRSAEALGARLAFTDGGWHYLRRCQCHQFGWINELFLKRQALGLRGAPLKLGINALYGKLAQTIGGRPYANLIWAGLITALVRARLNMVIAQDPAAIVMIATDAIISTRPLQLPRGDGLGEWKPEILDCLFTVRPGLWWTNDKAKHRGIPANIFDAPTRRRFEAKWRTWCDRQDGYDLRTGNQKLPIVELEIPLFIGLRLAQHRGKPETAGRWDDSPRKYSFDWLPKRLMEPFEWIGPRCLRTYPNPSIGPDIRSTPYGKVAKAEMDAMTEMAEIWQDQPDFIERTAPG
jgi:hypothetical protein